MGLQVIGKTNFLFHILKFLPVPHAKMSFKPGNKNAFESPHTEQYDSVLARKRVHLALKHRCTSKEIIDCVPERAYL